MSKVYPLQLFPCLYVLVTMRVGVTVKIHELKVPEVTKQGSSVILDCDYSLEDSLDQNGLVVKWFFNDQPNPVYQWISGSNKPQGSGILKDKLNLDYKASSDVKTMHRALHILQPSIELSGEYTCVVSTFRNEDKQTKRMVVFVPEKSFQLQKIRESHGITKVICAAERVYPQPNMAILMQQSELESTEVLHRDKSGLFDISAVAALPDGALEEPREFSCELRVPEANYTTRKESFYYPAENASSQLLGSVWMACLVKLLSKCVPLLCG